MSRLLDIEGTRTYADAGVSIAAGDDVVARIATSVDSTVRPGVLGGIGGFGGLFSLDATKYDEPVLVASADGVGTKLEVARLAQRYDTVGIDLVAMLVDDLVCVGAEPLFVLDYVAAGLVEPEQLAVLVAGIAEGCRQAGAALLGGETAEHGGVMKPDELDVAGFALGVVEKRDASPKTRTGGRRAGGPALARTSLQRVLAGARDSGARRGLARASRRTRERRRPSARNCCCPRSSTRRLFSRCVANSVRGSRRGPRHRRRHRRQRRATSCPTTATR